MIDAHAHIWSVNRLPYPFAPHDGLSAPTDDATFESFRDDAQPTGVAHVLLIQPRVYGYDHAYLYDVARATHGFARVMPLINVLRPTGPRELRTYAADELTAGYRVIALGPTPAAWLLSGQAQQAWSAITALGLPVGFLIDPIQLGPVREVARRNPDLRVVIDHMANCSKSSWSEHAGTLLELADQPNVHVKLSAVGALTDSAFPHEDISAFIRALYDRFGSLRLCWGSDWPHVRRYGPYAHSRLAVRQALHSVSDQDLQNIFNATASRLFGFSRKPEQDR
jgi:L-fuconolactonase